MKSAIKYLKLLFDANKRGKQLEQFQLSRIRDLDLDNYVREPEEMPDWAKALRAHNINIRSA